MHELLSLGVTVAIWAILAGALIVPLAGLAVALAYGIAWLVDHKPVNHYKDYG